MDISKVNHQPPSRSVERAFERLKKREESVGEAIRCRLNDSPLQPTDKIGRTFTEETGQPHSSAVNNLINELLSERKP